MTQAERLARIEAILEPMASDIQSIKADLAADKADLAQLKNRGIGILIGIALIGMLIGAKVRELAAGLFETLR